MASEDVQTNLRLPAELKDRLVTSAMQSNRSLSAEVTSRLEESYSPQKEVVTKEVLQDVFAEMARGQRAERLAQVSIRDLLATYLMQMYEALPGEAQKVERFKFAFELATQLKTDGNPDIENTLAKVLNTDELGPLQAAAAVIRRDTATKRQAEGPKP